MIRLLAFLRGKRPGVPAKIAALDDKSRPEAKKGGRFTAQASEGTEDLIVCCHDGGRAGFRPPVRG